VAQAKETHRLILAAVAQLSPANREAILLYYFEQLSVREIASLLQISVPAVKGRLHKSRRQLRAQLHSTFAEPQLRPSTIQTRRRQMIPVSVIDIAIPAPESSHRVLILMDEGGRRLLPIWIGPYEADNIALNLQGIDPSRPMTYTFMAGLLDKASVQIESVAVSALVDEAFYATVHAQRGEDAFAIDARPSDAIALALNTHSPIFVDAEVMATAAVDIPADKEVVAQGKGLQDLQDLHRKSASDREEQQRRQQEEMQQSKSPQEQREESREKLLAYLFEETT
jgi:bifunctional DNase/RNase/DNA-binding CsgD family transcriptional regulator